MTAPEEGAARLTWTDFRDAIYLSAWQDAAGGRTTHISPRLTGWHDDAGRGEPPPLHTDQLTATPGSDSEPAGEQGPSNGSQVEADIPQVPDPNVESEPTGVRWATSWDSMPQRLEQGSMARPLHGALAICRALRPLRMRRPAPGSSVLAEDATAEHVAASGIWLPVFHTGQERFLNLLLLVDEAPSMPLWRDVLIHLHELLEQTAAFRTIRTAHVDIATHGARLRRLPAAPAPHSPGQDWVVLVATDGMSGAWRNGDAAAFLHAQGQVAATAVLSLPPQEMWEYTLPSAVRTEVSVSEPGVPNRSWRIIGTAPRAGELGDSRVADHPQRLPVPLLELTPSSLGRWARLTAAVTSHHDVAALLAGRNGDQSWPGGYPVAPSLGRPSETVRRFVANASPVAVVLAGRLAAAPLNLPIIRRILCAQPDAQTWNLAEIMWFGLLRRIEPAGDVEDIGRISYDFPKGVREELLGRGTRAETLQVLRTVAEYVGPRLAAIVPGGAAALAWRPGSAEPPMNEQTRPFVTTLRTALLAISGPYLERARTLDRLLGGESDADIEPDPRRSDQVDNVERPLAAVPPVLPQPPLLPKLGVLMSTTTSLTDGRTEPKVKRPPSWGNVPLRNRNFTGREDLLEMLAQRLQEGVAAVLPEALHGMGGVGKSQIAVEYVYRHSKEYQLVWWIPSEQPNLIVQSLIELGEKLGLDAGADRGAVPAVLSALQMGEPYSSWLLVFDNAESPDEVRHFFPSHGPGRILVTSRNSRWSSLASSLEVDVFARSESVSLIKRRSSQISDAAADRLADVLGDLPLAVEQAAVWLAETGMPVEQYLDLFDRKYAELLRVESSTDYPVPVAAAWNVSLDRLREGHPAALQLLQVCAFFAPEPIGLIHFSAVRGVSAPPALRAALDDPIKLHQAVREIGRYALAKVDHSKSTLQLHRLVQRVLVEQMNGHERAAMRHCAHEILTLADPRNPDSQRGWSRYSELLPHVRASDAVSCENGWVRELVVNEARFLQARSDYAEALRFADEVAGTWRRTLGSDHEQVLAIDQVRALAMRWQSRFSEAFEVQEELARRCQRFLGEQHPMTQRALSVLAILLRVRGEFYRARELDEQAYQTTLAGFGPDDPATLQVAHNYAVSLRLAGDYRAAHDLDEDTWERRVVVLGEDHLQTLTSEQALCIDLQELGHFSDALQRYEPLLVKARNVLGPEHAHTIWFTRDLSVTRRKVGDHEGALELTTQVMALFERRQRDDPMGLIWASLNYATDQRQTGDLGKAAEFGRQAMEQCRTLLGSDHPHTHATATNLAVTLRLLGQRTKTKDLLREALELNEAAVASLRSVLGAEHPRTLLVATNLASDLFVAERFEEARNMDSELLEKSREIRGPEHPATLAVQLNLSYDAREMGQISMADDMYRTALTLFRRVHGQKHPATLDAETSKRANCDIDLLSI